jgi:putative transposase
MARPLRVEFEDAIYHLGARGNARQAIFHDGRDCARFLKLLSESAQRFEAAILCFVLMGNHFHLVAQTHRANLRRWMHWLLVC